MRPEHQTTADAYAPLRRIQRRRTIRQCALSALLTVCGIILAFQPEAHWSAGAVIAIAGMGGVILFGAQLLSGPDSPRGNP